MSGGEVLLEMDVATGIATITLNRPESLNALDMAMADALRTATKQVAADATVRAVIFRGAGEHFMAGGDVKAFHETLDDPAAERRALLERLIGEVHEAVTCIREMDKPVIASVRGAVAGFGFSLMAACDLAIAADTSYFTLAYRHIGTSPDGGSTYALPRLVGVKQAMEIAPLGERFGAARTLELGLINRVVPQAELAAATQALALELANGQTIALGRIKRLINESLNRKTASRTGQLRRLRHDAGFRARCAVTGNQSAFLSTAPESCAKASEADCRRRVASTVAA